MHQHQGIRHAAAPSELPSCNVWLQCSSRFILLIALTSTWSCLHVTAASGGGGGGGGGSATACTTATYTICPTAVQAARSLTGNSSYLPISNAVWSGPLAACNKPALATYPAILITSFPACNFLAADMPSGALVSAASYRQLGLEEGGLLNGG